ncbi:polysaccharide deacetylase family protein [Vibrio sp. DNF-1]|nr:polysaccharide deacetylase family protein [Vibrio salinus]MCE0493297.1 polysaccharide deacetylase family protein [Vibrio salinus]
MSYDDGLQSQLDNAIPALDHYGFKASFYILPTSKTVSGPEVEKWRNAAAEGHELGNHTLFHECSVSKGRTWVKPYANLDNKTVEEMVAEVRVANTFLYLIDGQKRRRSLTLPCGDSQTSNGNYAQAVAKKLSTYIYGRTFKKEHVAYLAPSGMSAKKIIRYIENSYQNKHVKIIILKFHGVGGDYLSTSKKDHDKILTYLNENRERFKVDTYYNIMQRFFN